MNLFRSTPGRLSEPDVPLSQGMADIAAIALLNEREARAAHATVKQLQGALQSRVLIEQAKGLLAARAGVSMDTAFTLLRGYARKHNRRLGQIAQELIDGCLDDAALTQAADRRRISER